MESGLSIDPSARVSADTGSSVKKGSFDEAPRKRLRLRDNSEGKAEDVRDKGEFEIHSSPQAERARTA
jgi:hypothetical protein